MQFAQVRSLDWFFGIGNPEVSGPMVDSIPAYFKEYIESIAFTEGETEGVVIIRLKHNSLYIADKVNPAKLEQSNIQEEIIKFCQQVMDSQGTGTGGYFTAMGEDHIVGKYYI